jgi:hypothetical protein
MAGADKAAVAEVLKRVYDNYVIDMQNLEHRAIDEIGKSSKNYNAGGEGFFGAINDEGNESVGAISETESFRSIDAESYQNWKVIPKVLVAPIQFSGLLAAAAQGDEESFANAVVRELDQAKERLMSDENRQFFGKGTGLLCSPSAAVASDLLSFTVDSTQYIRPNMVVDIFNGATKTVDSKRISRVDRQNSVVHFATSLGTALTATAEMVKENIRDSAASDGKEMMGLRGIVDDSTDVTTFQNLDASSLDIWRATRIDASSGNLTSDLLQRLEDDVALLSGSEPDTLIMHRKQRRKYLDILVPEKRYMDGKLDAGFSKLSFNGKELWLDKDCQDATVYAIKKSEIRKFEVSPLALAGHEGSDKYLRLSNQDAYQTYWRHYCNFGTGKRNAHGKIVSLAKPSGISG